MMQNPDIRCVWPLKAELGEGPVWPAAEDALWFVDIAARTIHRFDTKTGLGNSWPAPDRVSFVLPCRDGGFLAGMPGQLARFDPQNGKFEHLAKVEEMLPDNRLNDACVDAKGIVWFGSMDDKEREPNGVLYSWSGLDRPQKHDDGYTISNGPAFSPDGRFFYFTDTSKRCVYRFEVTENGGLSGKTVFIEFEPGAGHPDGTTVDSEGCLWIALYGGWGVARFSPKGERMESVKLPCANVTKLAFGGPDLTTAYVTTARQKLSPDQLHRQPLAGGIFAFEVECRGLPQHSVSFRR